MEFTNKKYLNVSYWGWPLFGGGEQFLFDCMKWAHNAGMDAYWICFADAKNNAFEKFNVVNTEYGTIMQISGGFSVKKMQQWIKLINPDIVNHQGLKRLEMVKGCYDIGYKCMTGGCFWNELVHLDESTYNKDIIKNIGKHKEAPEFRQILKYSTCLYGASYFVNDVIWKVSGVKLDDVIFSSSNLDNCKLLDFEKNSVQQKYVTLINYHVLKGGKILLYLIKNLTNVSFLGVKTEYGSEDLDKEIEQAIDNRNKMPNVAKCKYIGRQDRIKDVLKQTSVLLVASMVDETFCRTCNEALCNGIPVITTGKGNIGYMVENNAIILDENDHKKWADQVEKLWSDKKYYDMMVKKSLIQYEKSSESLAEKQFLGCLNKCLYEKGKDKNVMIFVPWCDQGLGIQGRIYVNILESIGYATHIFSFKTYMATEDNPRYQKNAKEWAHPSVFYSEYDRENTRDDELISFVQHKNIGKMILPEVCFDRVFEITELLNKYGVKTYCVPNIEICRSDELERYTCFEKVMCNNHYCENLLNDNGVFNTCYISHISLDKRIKFKKKKYDKGDKLKILNLGGLNAIVRKQCLKVCKAFLLAYEKCPNMEITISIQGSQIPEEIKDHASHPGINLIIDHLPYSEIIRMYQQSHLSIQVSKHEGLGLGFYESIKTGTPVLTLDTPLHNEIIVQDVNGWWIPCQYEDMKDNPKSLLKSALFEIQDLADKLVEIATDHKKTMSIIKNTRKDHDKRFNKKIISGLFYDALKTK